MKENKKEHSKRSIALSLPEESWQRLSAMANGQQRSLEGLVTEALEAYIHEQDRHAPDPKIKPIEDTEPAKS